MKFTTSIKSVFACAVVLAAAGLLPAGSQTETLPLKAGKPIVIPGGPGGFDWMLVDGRANRVYATHKGTKSVAVVDLKTEMALPSIAAGTAQGLAIARRENKLYFGDADEKKVMVFDNMTFKKVGEISVDGPVDDVIYCPKNGMIYADHDDGEDVWVIDPKTDKIVATVKIPEAPEKMEYDRTTERIYQNIKSNSTVQVIDPTTNKVEKVWQTAPATGPHGIAIDRKTQRLFSAGSNGKLVVIDMKTGRVTGSVDIEKGVDQIAYDAAIQRIYCACKGAISVVQVTDDGAKLVANVPAPKGAHTIAVHAADHSVWTCYFDTENSYLLKLVPPAAAPAKQ